MTGLWFRSDPADARSVVAIEGFAIIFHRPSGSTHLLASPAPEILEALDAGPADAPRIVDRLARRHNVEGGPDAEAVVSARLEELEAVGLVTRL